MILSAVDYVQFHVSRRPPDFSEHRYTELHIIACPEEHTRHHTDSLDFIQLSYPMINKYINLSIKQQLSGTTFLKILSSCLQPTFFKSVQEKYKW